MNSIAHGLACPAADENPLSLQSCQSAENNQRRQRVVCCPWSALASWSAPIGMAVNAALAPTLAPCHPIGQPWHSRRTAWNTPSAWSTSFQRWRRTTPYVRPHFAPSSQRLKAIGSSFGKRPCSRGGLVCELQLKTAQLDFEWPVATLPAIIF